MIDADLPVLVDRRMKEAMGNLPSVKATVRTLKAPQRSARYADYSPFSALFLRWYRLHRTCLYLSGTT
jgi:hypothetical protein